MRFPVLVMIAPVTCGLISASLVSEAATAIRGRTTVEGVHDARPEWSFDWRAGRGRLIGSLRHERLTAIRLTLPGFGAIESVSAGLLAIRWGGGASVLGRSPTGAAVVAAGGPRAMRGVAATCRVAGGKLFLAAGQRKVEVLAADPPERTRVRSRTAIAAWSRWGVGALAGIQDGTMMGTLSWSLRHPSGRCELELAPWGAERGLAARVETDAGGVAAVAGLRFRVANLRAAGAAARRGETDIEFDIRRSLARWPLAVGGLAGLADTRSSAFPLTLLGSPSALTSRVWIELVAPSEVVPAHVSVRGELRRAAGKDRSRLHLSMAALPARLTLDWTDGGGLLLNLRYRWDLPLGLGIESGAAAWSGPLPGTGSTLDLPHVPGQGLEARFAGRGQEAGFLLDWQMAQVRVRLGLSTRRSLDDVPDVRVASRLDLAWPLADRGS